jgi:iron complex outermembrane receptor protein
VIIVEETYSGFSNSIELPDYTLVNLGVSYETEDWLFSVSGKNLTDEEYFRANFPNLFGSTIALPELPRHYVARMQYKF